MEFREREVLAEILEMAKRREFDVLVMDVLDRLGRTGLPREIYRAELHMHGVRVLTTKPEEHADDDSLMGHRRKKIHHTTKRGEDLSTGRSRTTHLSYRRRKTRYSFV